MLKATDLTQRVSLQRNAGTAVDAYGQPSNTWGTYATVWASVRPLSGREQEIGAARGALISHRVRLRYRSGVEHGDRIYLGGRILEIISVRNIDEAKVELEIDAVERSA